MLKNDVISMIVKDYMELTANANGPIPYEKIPHISLVSAFWLMRITESHYASLRKSQSPGLSAEKVSSAVADIKCAIYHHFSKMFSDDFNHYALFMIDFLYTNLDEISNEWNTISSSRSIDKNFVDRMQHFINEAYKMRELITHFEERYHHLHLISAFRTGILPSFLIDINTYINQKRSTPLFYKSIPKNGEVSFWRRTKDSLNELLISLKNMKKLISYLFCLDDSILKEVLSHSGDAPSSSLAEFLYNLRYPPMTRFNLETTLLFIFLNHEDQSGLFSYLIKKYEALFYNLYLSLTSISGSVDDILFPQLSIDYREAHETFITIPNDVKPIEKKLSFFHLKKLISLQKFQSHISKKSLPNAEEKLFKRFDTILSYSKLPFLEYNYALNDLPSYVIDILGITQSELAELLNVDKSTISRQKNNNKLLQNNKWFWVAASGFSYEYINGVTTIPNYGRNTVKDDNQYFISVADYLAHGEMFLKRISSLSAYRKSLKNSKFGTKSNILSRSYLRQISAQSYILADDIKKFRIYVESLFERARNKQMEGLFCNEKEVIPTLCSKAVSKLKFYLEINRRMLDSLSKNHIIEIRRSMSDNALEPELKLLDQTEQAIDILSKLLQISLRCFNLSDNVWKPSTDFQEISESTLRQLSALSDNLSHLSAPE